MENPFQESPLQHLHHELFKHHAVEVFVKRDDLMHYSIQGNKWRKLKFNLLEARLNNYHTLLTFGGPFSNHIYATAAAAKLFHFKSIGIIRGEEPVAKSKTLEFAAEQGMDLYYMDRAMYRQKDDPVNIASLRVQIGDFYYLPEGGTNKRALEGVAETVTELDIDFDLICTPCGTGGTLAGLVAGLKGQKEVLGFSALKGADLLTPKINSLTESFCNSTFDNYSINFDYHFGGYAKITPELVDFMVYFKQQFGFQLDPVYTGKMFFGLFDLIKKNYFKPGTRIIVLHTGGLQGLSGYKQFENY